MRDAFRTGCQRGSESCQLSSKDPLLEEVEGVSTWPRKPNLGGGIESDLNLFF